MHDAAAAANSDWLRIAVYVVAALASAAVAVRSWGGRAHDDRWIATFWSVTAALLVLLALARGISFGAELAHWGRTVFRTEGWYPDRRPLQRDAILALVAGAGIVGVAGGGVLVARRWASLLPAFLLVVALLTFVSVRAISLHDIDAVLYRRSLADVQFSALIELLVTALIGLAAAVAATAPRPAPPPPRTVEMEQAD
ncbi:MAG TPA: hypothetical protein VFY79_00410 [Dehalococcoidia bacterium]|nr:hypothetical protein [Dehalococcoidia bacterium]